MYIRYSANIVKAKDYISQPIEEEEEEEEEEEVFIQP